MSFILLDSDAVCDHNLSKDGTIENDVIEMSCAINYSGNFAPVMIWRRDSGKTEAGVLKQTPNRSVKSTLTLRVTKLDNGHRISCTTKFTNISHSPAFAAWTSPALDVMCTCE